MKTQQSTRLVWIKIAILLGLTLLFYYGYCWGLWGRSSLVMQYLFQCSCPPVSEEARYPDEVDVIISACQQSYVELSPSGRLLAVHEEQAGMTSTYLLDLQSMERTEITNQPFSSFLTDELGFIESGLEDYIIDRTTGRQYPILAFSHWREDAYENGEPNLDLLVTALRQAEHVFFTQRNNDTVVILMPNFPADSDQSFTFNRSNIPSGDFSNKVEQFLQANDIAYQTIPEGFREEAISPNEKFIARSSGIYLIETGQRIIASYVIGGFFHPFSGQYLEVLGWTNDGAGVIYSKFLNPCLIEMGMLDGVACFYEVPQPLIILKMPEEYLTSTQKP